MKNDKKPISASEIGRYLYCNYAWYYERKYGLTELRRRHREYLEEAGIKPDVNSPIQRGLEYHANFGKRSRLRLVLKILAAIAVLAALAYFLLAWRGFV